ncbi:hypothetical protein BGZ63DRAFT_401219 [Mariannaea sp. PMI_226]|nr:hypothetical protein BGZ63DRAFT_401219 [Mariannaea sp. PMI_226]
MAASHNRSLIVTDIRLVYSWGTFRNGKTIANQLGPRPLGRQQETLFPMKFRIYSSKIKIPFQVSTISLTFASETISDRGPIGVDEAGYAGAAGSDEVILRHLMKISNLSHKDAIVLDGGTHRSAAITANGRYLMWRRLDGG